MVYGRRPSPEAYGDLLIETELDAESGHEVDADEVA